jgi:hypothetical protein
MFVNKDYKFRDDLVKTHSDTVPIELLMDPFKGIIFKFASVKIREEEDRSAAHMSFDYVLLEKLDFIETKLRKNKEFQHTLGLILNAMILEFADNYQETDADREDYSEEPVEERGLHPQGSSVPQA